MLSRCRFRPRCTRCEMPSPPSPSPTSISAVVQYAFLAVLAYFLAGAPFSSFVDFSSSGSDSGYDVNEHPRKGKVVDVKALESLVIPEKNLSCAEHRYKSVHILSREPLVVYIEGFLGEGEGNQAAEQRCGPALLSTSQEHAAACANEGGVRGSRQRNEPRDPFKM